DGRWAAIAGPRTELARCELAGGRCQPLVGGCGGTWHFLAVGNDGRIAVGFAEGRLSGGPAGATEAGAPGRRHGRLPAGAGATARTARRSGSRPTGSA